VVIFAVEGADVFVVPTPELIAFAGGVSVPEDGERGAFAVVAFEPAEAEPDEAKVDAAPGPAAPVDAPCWI
jgi:hypothetical protein